MYAPPTTAEREAILAPYATTTAASRGRRYPEPEHAFRPLFQRDRERIVHCAAFRRLMSKTQVLAAHTNDHHRTRLTHSLEVAQVSRTIASLLFGVAPLSPDALLGAVAVVAGVALAAAGLAAWSGLRRVSLDLLKGQGPARSHPPPR